MKINFKEGMKFSKQQDIELIEKYPYVWLIQYIFGLIALICFFLAGYSIAGLI